MKNLLASPELCFNRLRNMQRAQAKSGSPWESALACVKCSTAERTSPLFPPTFALSNSVEARKVAIAQAVANAKADADADAYAQSLRLRVAGVIEIVDLAASGEQAVAMQQMMRAMQGEHSGDVVTTEVRVQVSFALEPDTKR